MKIPNILIFSLKDSIHPNTCVEFDWRCSQEMGPWLKELSQQNKLFQFPEGEMLSLTVSGRPTGNTVNEYK